MAFSSLKGCQTDLWQPGSKNHLTLVNSGVSAKAMLAGC